MCINSEIRNREKPLLSEGVQNTRVEMLVPDPGTQERLPPLLQKQCRNKKKSQSESGCEGEQEEGQGDRDRKTQRGLRLFLICQQCLLWGTLKEIPSGKIPWETVCRSPVQMGEGIEQRVEAITKKWHRLISF